MGVDVGTVHSRVATGAPARPLGKALCVVGDADKQGAGARQLGVTSQAQVWITFVEHLVVDRAVRVVARRASFTKRFMLKNMGPGLFAMALPTDVVYSRYPDIFRAVNILAVGIVAVDADHTPDLQRVVILEVNSRFFLRMTLKADFQIPLRIDDVYSAASSRLHMKAAGAVTVFATRIVRLCIRVQMPVGRIREISSPLTMAEGTRFHAHEFGTRVHEPGPDDGFLSGT